MIALVTGGASSGKSAFAERLALSLPGPHVYAATMRHGDAETEARIQRHREKRAGKGFVTVELVAGSWVSDESASGESVADESVSNGSTSGGLASGETAQPESPSFTPVAGTVLLEDLSNLVLNDCTSLLPLVLASDNVVVVANEIGADGAHYDDFTLGFIDQLGALACGIAAQASLVVEVVAGLPKVVKGELPWDF